MFTQTDTLILMIMSTLIGWAIGALARKESKEKIPVKIPIREINPNKTAPHSLKPKYMTDERAYKQEQKDNERR